MSKAIVEPTGAKKCPVCKKQFFVQWPHQWAYKRGSANIKYYCSWKCLRELEKKGEDKYMARRKITKEQEQEAVQIALDGGDPLSYLQEHGINNPAQKWYDIKESVKDSDPEIYAQLPNRIQRKAKQPTLADAMTGMQDAADQFFGACEDMGLKMETPEKPLPVQDLKLQSGGNYRISVETPEAPKICKPVIYDGMIIREVESLFGRLRRSDVHGSIYLDFEPTDFTDVLSYTVDQWRSFFRDLKDCAAILGVEL